MPAESSRQNACGLWTQFRSDLRRRYPGPSEPAGGRPEEAPPDVEFTRRLGHLPAEVGVLLMVIGLAGVMLPGPVGSPFVLAGGLILWPRGFGKAEAWFERRFPNMHRKGVAQIWRFLDDLEQRYPGSVR